MQLHHNGGGGRRRLTYEKAWSPQPPFRAVCPPRAGWSGLAEFKSGFLRHTEWQGLSCLVPSARVSKAQRAVRAAVEIESSNQVQTPLPRASSTAAGCFLLLQ